MVTQNQEQTQVTETGTGDAAPTGDAPEQTPVTESEPSILSEIDRLNNAPEVDISTPVEEPAVETSTEPKTSQPVAEEKPVTTEEPEPKTFTEIGQKTQDSPPQPTQEQFQAMQRQAVEYEEIKRKAAVHEEPRKYQHSMEQHGYTEEQAQQGAQQYIQSRQAQQNLMQKADEYGQHILGKVQASEHFARQYDLGMGDLSVLRQAENPQIMEEMAKKISEDRKMKTELEQLRKAQVPPQQFDNSQGQPQVASSDASWLDRYNAGDRSPSAQAAARKATGLD